MPAERHILRDDYAIADVTPAFMLYRVARAAYAIMSLPPLCFSMPPPSALPFRLLIFHVIAFRCYLLRLILFCLPSRRADFRYIFADDTLMPFSPLPLPLFADYALFAITRAIFRRRYESARYRIAHYGWSSY